MHAVFKWLLGLVAVVVYSVVPADYTGSVMSTNADLTGVDCFNAPFVAVCTEECGPTLRNTHYCCASAVWEVCSGGGGGATPGGATYDLQYHNLAGGLGGIGDTAYNSVTGEFRLGRTTYIGFARPLGVDKFYAIINPGDASSLVFRNQSHTDVVKIEQGGDIIIPGSYFSDDLIHATDRRLLTHGLGGKVIPVEGTIVEYTTGDLEIEGLTLNDTISGADTRLLYHNASGKVTPVPNSIVLGSGAVTLKTDTVTPPLIVRSRWDSGDRGFDWAFRPGGGNAQVGWLTFSSYYLGNTSHTGRLFSQPGSFGINSITDIYLIPEWNGSVAEFPDLTKAGLKVGPAVEGTTIFADFTVGDGTRTVSSTVVGMGGGTVRTWSAGGYGHLDMFGDTNFQLYTDAIAAHFYTDANRFQFWDINDTILMDATGSTFAVSGDVTVPGNIDVEGQVYIGPGSMYISDGGSALETSASLVSNGYFSNKAAAGNATRGIYLADTVFGNQLRIWSDETSVYFNKSEVSEPSMMVLNRAQGSVEFSGNVTALGALGQASKVTTGLHVYRSGTPVVALYDGVIDGAASELARFKADATGSGNVTITNGILSQNLLNFDRATRDARFYADVIVDGDITAVGNLTTTSAILATGNAQSDIRGPLKMTDDGPGDCFYWSIASDCFYVDDDCNGTLDGTDSCFAEAADAISGTAGQVQYYSSDTTLAGIPNSSVSLPDGEVQFYGVTSWADLTIGSGVNVKRCLDFSTGGTRSICWNPAGGGTIAASEPFSFSKYAFVRFDETTHTTGVYFQETALNRNKARLYADSANFYVSTEEAAFGDHTKDMLTLNRATKDATVAGAIHVQGAAQSDILGPLKMTAASGKDCFYWSNASDCFYGDNDCNGTLDGADVCFGDAGGNPGGSPGEVQWNDNGNLDGIADVNYNSEFHEMAFEGETSLVLKTGAAGGTAFPKLVFGDTVETAHARIQWTGTRMEWEASSTLFFGDWSQLSNVTPISVTTTSSNTDPIQTWEHQRSSVSGFNGQLRALEVTPPKDTGETVLTGGFSSRADNYEIQFQFESVTERAAASPFTTWSESFDMYASESTNPTRSHTEWSTDAFGDYKDLMCLANGYDDTAPGVCIGDMTTSCTRANETQQNPGCLGIGNLCVLEEGQLYYGSCANTGVKYPHENTASVYWNGRHEFRFAIVAGGETYPPTQGAAIYSDDDENLNGKRPDGTTYTLASFEARASAPACIEGGTWRDTSDATWMKIYRGASDGGTGCDWNLDQKVLK